MDVERPDSKGKGLYGGLPALRVYRHTWAALGHPSLVHGPEPGSQTGLGPDTQAFLSHRPLEVEIGFGRPYFLVARAQQLRDTHFVGFETRRRWCEWLLADIDRLALPHIRVIHGDARAWLDWLLPAGSVQAFYIQFPDPWPKSRHHHRRVMAGPTLTLLGDKLATGGRIVVKTDVLPYLQAAEHCALADGRFEVQDPGADTGMPRTHREKKCLEVGTPFFVRYFVKRAQWRPSP